MVIAAAAAVARIGHRETRFEEVWRLVWFESMVAGSQDKFGGWLVVVNGGKAADAVRRWLKFKFNEE